MTEVLGHVRAVLGVAATGVLLLDADGGLQSARSSPVEAVLLDSVQVEHDQSPGRDCVRAGYAVAVPDLRRTGDRWPRFAQLCHRVGIGAADAGRIGRAFAQATGAALRLRRSIEHDATVMGQLEHALHSRVVIEQAKGMVAVQHHVSIDRAFATLRAHARHNNIRLTELCHASPRASSVHLPRNRSDRAVARAYRRPDSRVPAWVVRWEGDDDPTFAA